MIPRDTHPEVYARQIEVWRRLGPEGRIAQAIALSEALRTTAREEIRRQNPAYSELELRLAFIDRMYGPELAGRVRAHFERRRQ